LSPDGKWLVHQGLEKGELAVREVSSKKLISFKAQKVRKIAFSPDSKRFAAIATDTMNVWDMATGREVVHALKIPRVMDMAFSPDGKHIVTGGTEPALRIWDATTGRQLRTLEDEGGTVNIVAFSRDGKLLATSGSYMTVKLWDMASLAEALDKSR